MTIRRIVQTNIVVLFAAYFQLQAQNLQSTANDALGRTTPRGTVVGFLTAAHKGDWNTAAQYLESTKGEDRPNLRRNSAWFSTRDCRRIWIS
jgi:hypothetical protein